MSEEKHIVNRPWDTCRQVPVVHDEQTPWKGIKLLKFVTLCVVTLLVFGLAICSKTSLLLLVTLSGEAMHTVPAEHKPLILLCVGCTLVTPSILLLFKSLWKACFKTSKIPARATAVFVLFIDVLVSLGSAVLLIVVMPSLDIITNVMLLNSIALLSAVFQVAAQCCARERNRFLLPPISAFLLILLGHVLFLLSLLLDEKSEEMVLWSGVAVFATFLVSLNWWENYVSLFSNSRNSIGTAVGAGGQGFFYRLSEDLKHSQNMQHIMSSLMRILVTAAVLGAFVPLSGREWTSLATVPDDVKKVSLTLTGVQLVSSVLCHWFAVMACKMHAMRRSFLLPMYLASLAVLVLFVCPVMISFQNHRTDNKLAHNFTFTNYCNDTVRVWNQDLQGDWFQLLVLDTTHTLCGRDLTQVTEMVLLGGSALAWWLGLLLSTIYISSLKLQRIQRTEHLFVRRMYEGAFLEQSMLLNTRFEIKKTGTRKFFTDSVTVFVCATMWHETCDEMMKIMISLFRLDRYRPKMAPKTSDVSFECHVYFDDAFKDVPGSQGRHVNEYAEVLVEVIKEVYSIFTQVSGRLFTFKPPIPGQRLMRTPYGGRLEVTMPHGNSLVVHFKDKHLIRHKKRWSQVMYMYYHLGWRLTAKYWMNGRNMNELKKQMEKEKQNTYILALDGDTDFQPSAVMVLVDRLKQYPHVGAACGRIHPTGTGPMVWFQKFEYAMGHWLQKTAEHVLGSVLCSPGCFSLYRAAALMDDNVMKTYTSKSTEAIHYVRNDQGEDRWLCLLLLRQGWRVEYNSASDAYTNAPEGFKEFFNQRRRWVPSTMANTVELLGSGFLTSTRNPSISRLYIFYQLMTMVTAILGPATMCIMIAGSLTLMCNIEFNGALILSVIPPAVYLALCFKLKSDTLVTIAAIMSVCYSIFMMALPMILIDTMISEDTILSPSSLFCISMVAICFVTGLMHPQEMHLLAYGVLYILCTPSAYLLLIIYSITNMNNMSWGTREAAPSAGAQRTAPTVLGSRFLHALPDTSTSLTKCCNCLCWKPGKENMVSIEVVEPVDGPHPIVTKHIERSLGEEREEDPPSTRVHQDWIMQLQTLSDEMSLHEHTLDAEEEEFWKELQKKYLEPLAEDKDKQTKINNSLRELRNKVSFVFFFTNSLWLVAAFILQFINLKVPIPKLNQTLERTGEYMHIDPVAFMSLFSFALLIAIQFLTMFYHRLYTLIHYVAFEDTESKSRKQAKQHLVYLPPDNEVHPTLTKILKSKILKSKILKSKILESDLEDVSLSEIPDSDFYEATTDMSLSSHYSGSHDGSSMASSIIIK